MSGVHHLFKSAQAIKVLAVLTVLAVLSGFMPDRARASDLPAIPRLSNHITDLTATLSAETLVQIEQRLVAFEQRKGAQIAVLIIPSTQDEAIEQYALRVLEQSKLGRKKIDDGALLLIVRNDRNMRIEVGYGLEGGLNDASAKRIISDIITPHFKASDYDAGVTAGIDAMIKLIDGEPLPLPVSLPEQNKMQNFSPNFMGIISLVFFAAVTLGALLRSVFGRFPGAILSACLIGLLVWLLAGYVIAGLAAALFGFFMTLAGGRMGMGVWHGGLGSSGSQGSMGGFHGSSGRGFSGGGGASGRW